MAELSCFVIRPTPVFVYFTMPCQRPRWCSLIAEYDLTNLTKAPTVIGSDSLVQLLHLDPGLLMGLWKVRISLGMVCYLLWLPSKRCFFSHVF